MLRDALPTKAKAKHHSAMPYVELGAFMDQLRDKESPRLTATPLTKGNRAMTYLARARLRTLTPVT